jgi:thiol-disulfide isomerase/thioredoxin
MSEAVGRSAVASGEAEPYPGAGTLGDGPAGPSAELAAPAGPSAELAAPAGPSAELAGPAGPEEGVLPGHRRSRTVLWASVSVAVVVAALVAVIASAQPSSEVLGKSPLLGEQAPPISGPGLGGGHYSLAQFKGKWALVNFMATWCVPCREEMPQLLEFSRQHAKDAVVLAVAYDPSNVAQLREYLAAEGAHWPAVNDPTAPVSYGVQGLPSSFLVAPGGTVVAYIEGGARASELDKLMAEAEARGIAG